MSKIAFFDFDGTITSRDTMLEMIRSQKGKLNFYKGFLINAPILAALKLKIVSNQFAKEQILQYFFKGTDISAFQLGCEEFVNKVLPAMIRPDAVREIQSLKNKGFEIVVVSASAENWIKKWVEGMGLQLIATRLATEGQLLTGKIQGKNCNGQEKETRIRSVFDLSKYDQIYCYGDSAGDKQMLSLATKAFYKPFRR